MAEETPDEGIIPVFIDWPHRERYFVGYAEYKHKDHVVTIEIDASSIEGQTLTTLMDAGLAKMSISMTTPPIVASN